MRRLGALAAAVLLLGTAPAVEQVGRTRAAIQLPDRGARYGSVILIPGGSTRQTIAADGATDVGGNFVMRTRESYVEAGFAIAYVDDPSDLRPIIARMRLVARPVFLLSTSNGTAVAARIAATLGPDGPDGIVLTSTVTKSTPNLARNAASVDLRRIAVPVLFVHNKNDGCFASPPGAIASLIARFSKETDVTRIDVSSANTDNDPCGPFAPHGYMGVESDVVSQIIAWMREHGIKGAN